MTGLDNVVCGDRDAQVLVTLVCAGEKPSTLSQRDGKFLPLVPRSERLSKTDLQSYLGRALSIMPEQARQSARLAAAQAKLSPKDTSSLDVRSVAAWVRSLAYRQAGNARQALKDAAYAVAHAPQRAASPALQALEGLMLDGDDARASLHCAWAPALVAKAAAHQAFGQHVEATLAALMALELQPLDAAAEQLLQQAMDRMPATARDTMHLSHSAIPGSNGRCLLTGPDADGSGPADVCGAGARRAAMCRDQPKALLLWRQGQHLKSMPEFLRPKEKYHHYHLWMRGRALQALGLKAADSDAIEHAPSCTSTDNATGVTREDAAAAQLPEEVMQKLLGMNADDLDLILKYPVAVMAQVVELLSVLQRGGKEGLAKHVIEPPSWEEVQLLTGPNCTGLPLGWNGGSDDQLQLIGGPAPSAIPQIMDTADDPLHPVTLEVATRSNSTGAVTNAASPYAAWQSPAGRMQLLLQAMASRDAHQASEILRPALLPGNTPAMRAADGAWDQLGASPAGTQVADQRAGLGVSPDKADQAGGSGVASRVGIFRPELLARLLG